MPDFFHLTRKIRNKPHDFPAYDNTQGIEISFPSKNRLIAANIKFLFPCVESFPVRSLLHTGKDAFNPAIKQT
jgi:hypothetical protein